MALNVKRIAHILHLDPEDFLSKSLWKDTVVRCECSRRGTGELWLFRGHVGLEFEDGQHAVITLSQVNRLCRSKRTFIQHNSFAAQPVHHALLQLTSDDESIGSVILAFPDYALGEQVAKAVEFLWRHENNDLSELEGKHLACNRFEDVVAVAALLPVREHCIYEADGKRDGILEVTTEGVVAFTSSGDPKVSRRWELTDIRMIRTTRAGLLGEGVSIQDSDETVHIFSGFQNRAVAEDNLIRAWCLACNSEVNFEIYNKQVLQGDFCASPHRKRRQSSVMASIRELPDKVCFSLKEVLNLLNTFKSIDQDCNGRITRDEWVDSLGPVFRHTQIPHAVFGVFDHNRDDSISFAEFLFGCRILHLGTPEDRIHFQYRIFDPSSEGWLTLPHFKLVAKSLQDAVGLPVPPPHTVESYCELIFNKFERHDGKVDMIEFRDALAEDRAFSEAFTGLARAREKAERTKIKNGRLVWFGNPHWLQCTAILLGIKLAVNCRRQQEPFGTDATKDAFHEKVTWELGSREFVSRVDRRKHSPGWEGRSAKGVHPLIAYESYFTDHAPRVFFALQRRFGVEPDDYLHSLGIDQLQSSMLVGTLTNLCSKSSSGRSGAFFYASHDGKYMLKKIPVAEGKELIRVLPSYYNHVMAHKDTLLTRYFGLHTLSFGKEEICFIVMDNVLPGTEDLVYDLKGSTVNRTTPVEKRVDKVALKDLDFRRKIDIPHEMRKALMAQIRADSAMLMREHLNDYSLLLGIQSAHTVPKEADDSHSMQRPIFRQYHGGMLSSDKREVFYLGIIDILTAFGLRKKGEHYLKAVRYKGEKVSCVPPDHYRERFVQYIESIFETNRATQAWDVPVRTVSRSPPARPLPAPASAFDRPPASGTSAWVESFDIITASPRNRNSPRQLQPPPDFSSKR